MNYFTFLTDEQVTGVNKLGILKKYGLNCAITDFSILYNRKVILKSINLIALLKAGR